MKTKMWSLALMLVGLVAIAGAQAGEKLGAGVSLTESVKIADLYAAPEKFVGKTIRVDGVVTAVCEDMGCWMALGAADDKDLVVRVKVEDGVIVFPVSAKGKKASAEGVFEKLKADDKEGHEAAAEQKSGSAKADAFGKAYQLKGLGAVIYQ